MRSAASPLGTISSASAKATSITTARYPWNRARSRWRWPLPVDGGVIVAKAHFGGVEALVMSDVPVGEQDVDTVIVGGRRKGEQQIGVIVVEVRVVGIRRIIAVSGKH